MKTVAILHGWAGGPKRGKQFTRNLEAAGFRVVKKAEQADFVIAHSTGCYFLPKNIKAELVVCINPPYWPGEPIVERWIRMDKNEAKFLIKRFGPGTFLRNKFWEIYYVFAKPRYTWSVLKNQSHLEFLDQLSDKQMILVRNKEDEFCSPQIKKVINEYNNFKYIEIPGYHSDYYIDPKPYIDLLKQEL